MDIFSYWKIGQFVQNKKDVCRNIHLSCSSFLSYYYGNSFFFSLYYIRMMEKLYFYFPIFLDCMRKIHWNSYLQLLSLCKKECYFYYQILLFCGDDSFELEKLIQSKLYFRI